MLIEGQAARALRRPGRALGGGLGRAQGAGRAACHSRLHQPGGQERLSRDAPAVARLGRPRHPGLGAPLPQGSGPDLRHRLQLRARPTSASPCRRAKPSSTPRSIPPTSTRRPLRAWACWAMPSWCSQPCSTRCSRSQKSPRDAGKVAAEISEVHDAWLAKWMPKLTEDAAPLNPYRVLWDLQKTVDVANTIITHDAGSPRDQLSPFWRPTTPLVLYRLGQDHPARLRPGARHGGQARQAGQALHQRVGRCGHRLHGHGFRDGGARAHSRSFRSCSTISRWRSSSR